MTETTAPAPFVGQAATIRYYTDTRAAVVTKVTAKTITIARVETTDAKPDEACDAGAYGLRPMRAEGILDRPIAGTELVFRFTKRNRWENQGCVARLGSSVEWVDYRN